MKLAGRIDDAPENRALSSNQQVILRLCTQAGIAAAIVFDASGAPVIAGDPKLTDAVVETPLDELTEIGECQRGVILGRPMRVARARGNVLVVVGELGANLHIGDLSFHIQVAAHALRAPSNRPSGIVPIG